MRTEIIPFTVPGVSVYISNYEKVSPKGRWCTLHLHTEHEIVRIESGAADFVSTSGEIFHVCAGDLISIASSVPHEVFFTEDNSLLNVLQFNENDFMSLGDEVSEYIDKYTKCTSEPIVIIKNEKARRIFDCILDEFRSKERGYQLFIKGYIYEMVALLARERVFDIRNITKRDPIMEKIAPSLSFIKNNFAKQLTLSEISGKSGLAPSYFCRVFKKAMGISCVDYLNRVRMTEAVDMLVKTDKSIISISLDTGFSSPSYFNRVFKSVYKCSPTEYKNAKNSGMMGSDQ